MISIADLSFNGAYPYIDPGTGGNINGMIAAADKILSLADLDSVWGQGIINSDQRVQIVYLTL